MSQMQGPFQANTTLQYVNQRDGRKPASVKDTNGIFYTIDDSALDMCGQYIGQQITIEYKVNGSGFNLLNSINGQQLPRDSRQGGGMGQQQRQQGYQQPQNNQQQHQPQNNQQQHQPQNNQQPQQQHQQQQQQQQPAARSHDMGPVALKAAKAQAFATLAAAAIASGLSTVDYHKWCQSLVSAVDGRWEPPAVNSRQQQEPSNPSQGKTTPATSGPVDAANNHAQDVNNQQGGVPDGDDDFDDDIPF